PWPPLAWRAGGFVPVRPGGDVRRLRGLRRAQLRPCPVRSAPAVRAPQRELLRLGPPGAVAAAASGTRAVRADDAKRRPHGLRRSRDRTSARRVPWEDRRRRGPLPGPVAVGRPAGRAAGDVAVPL